MLFIATLCQTESEILFHTNATGAILHLDCREITLEDFSVNITVMLLHASCVFKYIVINFFFYLRVSWQIKEYI